VDGRLEISMFDWQEIAALTIVTAALAGFVVRMIRVRHASGCSSCWAKKKTACPKSYGRELIQLTSGPDGDDQGGQR